MQILELVAIGLFAGLIGGTLGVGGSIVMIPAMTEVLGPDQHLYQASAMIVNFFVVVPAVYQHRRAGAIDPSTVKRLVPMTLVAVVGGVGLSELPLFAGQGEAHLRGLFGLFLLAVAGYELYRVVRARKMHSGKATSLPGSPTDAEGFSDGQRLLRSCPTAGGKAALLSGSPTDDAKRPVGWLRLAAVALPTGLVAGLLGVGGGLLAVPLQRRLLGIPIRTAIANSATVIIATSLVGASVKNYAYMLEHGTASRPVELAAILVPTAIVGSLIGGGLAHRLPLKALKVAFFVLLLLAAVRLSYQAFGSL